MGLLTFTFIYKIKIFHVLYFNKKQGIFFLLNKNKVISDMWIIRSNFFYLSAQVRLLETCDGCVQQNWLYQN